MMGSDGSLSLSEISGLPLPSEPPAKASNATAEAGIDDLIEKLRNLDNGLPCLLEKTRQDISVTKEALSFFKKRAAIEEEYGRQLTKLSQSMMEGHDRQQLVSDTLTQSWTNILKIHETIGEQRLKFGSEISEIAEDISFLIKDIDKKRKTTKDLSTRHERVLIDVDLALTKAKQRYELHSEEWESKLMQVKNEAMGMGLKGMFKPNRNQAQLNKYEDEARIKAAAADEQYKQQLSYANNLRKDYFEEHLPKMLSTLKGTDEEICVALRYQLARYAYSFEQMIVANGNELDNEQAGGLRTIITRIDKDSDLRNYVDAHGGRFTSSQSRELKYEKYEMAVKIDEQQPVKGAKPTPIKTRPIFGIKLQELLDQEGNEVPMILRICTQTIEAYGLHNQGIYRLSGAASHIRKVKSLIEQANSVFLLTPEDYSGDINSVTGALKLWFRELPDPLIPRRVSDQFIAAAKCEDERVRVISLHTAINKLPDANYATLRYLANHLDKIQQHEVYNKMGTPNLAIIFGPTLMGGDKEGYTFDESKTLQDMQWHVRVVETILENYRVIFEPDEE
ncbi:Rho GTPase activation protein [Umbelopsis sp. PMI_123]|nr:Rho GTPase activation protein [Umbelopsis sp. PMI_123]